MTEPPAPGTFTVRVPPVPEHLTTVRLFAAAVARAAGCSEEVVEDARVAVSEACAQACRERDSGGPIEVSLTPDGERVAVVVRDPGLPAGGGRPVAGPDEDVIGGAELIEALFGDVVVRVDGAATTVRFALPLGE